MKIVTIPQKMSNTGTIHDIASQHCDREIKFPKGAKYAVVLADYYGGKGYTTHQTESAAIQADKRNKEYSRTIIGADGWVYYVDMSASYDGELVRDTDYREPYEVESFEAVTQAASLMGKARKGSAAATKASRENGKKGGRPPKVTK